VKVEVDMSELSDLAQTLLNETPKQAMSAAKKVTIAETRAMKSRAQAGAPRDRPWLAQQGIRMKTFTNPNGVAGNVYTTPDPEGRPVGFFVEYGTSVTPPQAFMEPALTPAESTYPTAVLAAVDPFGSDPGDGGGGDE
jgi:hypothetical protein